jgi:hypothetical protein
MQWIIFLSIETTRTRRASPAAASGALTPNADIASRTAAMFSHLSFEQLGHRVCLGEKADRAAVHIECPEVEHARHLGRVRQELRSVAYAYAYAYAYEVNTTDPWDCS